MDAAHTVGSVNTNTFFLNSMDIMPNSSKDCFVRDEFVDYRDDMGGVGSFNRQN